MADIRSAAGEGSEPRVPSQDQPAQELANLIAQSTPKPRGFWRRRRRKPTSDPAMPQPAPDQEPADKQTPGTTPPTPAQADSNAAASTQPDVAGANTAKADPGRSDTAQSKAAPESADEPTSSTSDAQTPDTPATPDTDPDASAANTANSTPDSSTETSADSALTNATDPTAQPAADEKRGTAPSAADPAVGEPAAEAAEVESAAGQSTGAANASAENEGAENEGPENAGPENAGAGAEHAGAENGAVGHGAGENGAAAAAETAGVENASSTTDSGGSSTSPTGAVADPNAASADVRPRPTVGVVYEPDESPDGFPLEYGNIIVGLPKAEKTTASPDADPSAATDAAPDDANEPTTTDASTDAEHASSDASADAVHASSDADQPGNAHEPVAAAETTDEADHSADADGSTDAERESTASADESSDADETAGVGQSAEVDESAGASGGSADEAGQSANEDGSTSADDGSTESAGQSAGADQSAGAASGADAGGDAVGDTGTDASAGEPADEAADRVEDDTASAASDEAEGDSGDGVPGDAERESAGDAVVGDTTADGAAGEGAADGAAGEGAADGAASDGSAAGVDGEGRDAGEARGAVDGAAADGVGDGSGGGADDVAGDASGEPAGESVAEAQADGAGDVAAEGAADGANDFAGDGADDAGDGVGAVGGVGDEDDAVEELTAEQLAERLAAEQAAMALITALMKLRGVLASSQLPLEVVGADEARQQQKAMLDQLDDYLLPRLVQLEAPVLAVVGGSTGAGKSTLVNTVIGKVVSEPGVLRPTTRSPVLIHHPADADWFVGDRVLPGMARTSSDEPGGMEDAGQLRLVAADTVPRGLAILDAPDIDSVVEANRDLATQLLAAADLWLFVTTAARYSDAVPWEFLQSASDRSTAVAVVLDRAPSETIDDITGHLAQMLLERGLGDSPLFSIQETVVDGNGMLPQHAVASIKDWLIDLAADAEARAAVVRRTLQGAVSAMVKKTPPFAAAVKAQVDTAVELRSSAEAAYDQGVKDIAKACQDGTLLRGEVLARWQEFVGTGELLKGLQSNAGRLGDRLKSSLGNKPAETRDVSDAIQSGLESLLREHATEAAERAEKAWQATAPGRQLLASADQAREGADGNGDGPSLGAMSEQFPAAAGRAVREWQAFVLDLVRQEGANKKSTARILEYGVNGLGLSLMVVVFASGAGIPKGAEASAGVGSAVVGQRLLEAVFGDKAVPGMVDRAREDLDGKVHALMDAEFARYLAVLDQHPVDAETARQLTEAARAVEDCT